MPHYEFFCHNCKKVFSRILSLSTTKGARSFARTAEARASSSAGRPSTPSRRRRAREYIPGGIPQQTGGAFSDPE